MPTTPVSTVSPATNLCYILDPKEVHGEDFPGEIFRVRKEKEIYPYAKEIRC